MTRSRGRAAPPRPQPSGLPNPGLQVQIAQAVHQAICDLTQTDGAQCCALYAAVAANCMPHSTGAKYTINSGTLTVATQPNGDGFQFNVASPLIADAEFHALLVRDHGAGRFEVAILPAATGVRGPNASVPGGTRRHRRCSSGAGLTNCRPLAAGHYIRR